MSDLDTATQARTPQRWLWCAVAVLALLAAFVGGAAGLDFGVHWDEWQHLDAANEALATGRVLPRFYNYPALTFDLTWASALAQVKLARWSAEADAPYEAWLEDYVLANSGTLQLRTRCVFLALSMFAGVALFVLSRALHGWAFAALATTLFACSHEYLYHARWIAPDGLLATAATACLAAVALAARSGKTRWLVLAAAAAGLAASAKYTGVFLVVPVILAGPVLGVGARRNAWGRATWLAMLAGAVFLVSTPGALLEAPKMLGELAKQREIYAAGHRVYTVGGGWDHAWHMLVYGATQLFDRWIALNLVLAVLAAVGLVAALRRERRLSLVLLSGALPYLAMLVAHRTFIVRNLIVWIPLVALLAALGLSVSVSRLPKRARTAAWVVVAAVLSLLLARRVDDGLQIARHAQDQSQAFRAAKQHLDEHPELRVYVARDVRWRLNPLGLRIEGAVLDPDRAEHALVLPQRFPSVSPWLIERWYGVHDVNYAYYHSWHQRKPALVDIELAREFDEL